MHIFDNRLPFQAQESVSSSTRSSLFFRFIFRNKLSLEYP